MKENNKSVIPPAMMPSEGMTEVRGKDENKYLLKNDVMFTAVQHSRGEFSDFFLALRDECRIFGHRCPKCLHIIIPPFMEFCEHCNFVSMQKEDVKDIGIMSSSAVITIFAPSRFKDQVPFGTGRVYLMTNREEHNGITNTAMMVRVRTTKGLIKPDIFNRGTLVKIVFADKRTGEMTDIFAVPTSELSAEQKAKSPLMESDLEWDKLEYHREEYTRSYAERVGSAVEASSLFRVLSEKVSKSPRATKDLSNWSRLVRIIVEGIDVFLDTDNGVLEIYGYRPVHKTEHLTIDVPDAKVILLWLEDALRKEGELRSPALTDLVLEGNIRLSKNELEVITRLDRLPRSLRRDGVL